MSQYVFNLNGKQYIGNIGGQSVIGNMPMAYTKDEMIAFLADNVEITGWETVADDDLTVRISFTPITDGSALKYLDGQTWNDGDMVFFQLLRHKVTFDSNSLYWRANEFKTGSPMKMPWPDEFIYDSSTQATPYIVKSYSTYYKATGRYSSLWHTDADTVYMARTNDCTSSAYYADADRPYVMLTSEAAEQGHIDVRWRPYLARAGTKQGKLPQSRMYLAGEGGVSGPNGQFGDYYTIWAPELITQGSKSNWYDNEDKGVRPERSWVYYPDDYE